jgi:hypothetical protein
MSRDEEIISCIALVKYLLRTVIVRFKRETLATKYDSNPRKQNYNKPVESIVY